MCDPFEAFWEIFAEKDAENDTKIHVERIIIWICCYRLQKIINIFKTAWNVQSKLHNTIFTRRNKFLFVCLLVSNHARNVTSNLHKSFHEFQLVCILRFQPNCNILLSFSPSFQQSHSLPRERKNYTSPIKNRIHQNNPWTPWINQDPPFCNRCQKSFTDFPTHFI